MRSRRDTFILAALIALIVLLAFLVGSRRREAGNDPRPSTFVSAPLGASALRQVLQELKLPLGRRLEPFADAGPLQGPLAVLAPSEPPSPAEVHALAEWVRGGGTLIYAARRRDPTLDTLRLKLRTLARDTGYAELLYRGRAASVAAGPLTEGVGVVDGFRRGFEPASASLSHATVLASAGNVPVVLDFRLGKGRVIAWSDAYPLVNHTLKNSRAAILFARTAADAAKGGGTLWFDEYHHGFSEGGGTLAGATRFLASRAAGHAALQVTVALLGLLLLFGRRFGAPLPPPPARRRSPLEHVEALAGAYRQARAAATARRLLMAGLARRLGRRVPHETKAEGELLRRLAAHPTAGDAARALEAEWKKGAGADLVALSRDVDRYLEEAVKT